MEFKLIKTTIKEEFGKKGKNYASVMCNGVEVGFIDDDGIYLRWYNQIVPHGVYNLMDLPTAKTFRERCKFVEQHAAAIYDRYDLWVKKNPCI